MTPPNNDLTRTLLAILSICILIGFSLWVIKPFLPALLWATMITVATWPLLLAAQTKLHNKRSLAVTVMVAILLLIFVIPFTLAITAIADNAGQITDWVKSLTAFQFPESAPESLQKLPFIGDEITKRWHDYVSTNGTNLSQRIAPYISKTVSWFIKEISNFGLLTMQFLLTVMITAILYVNGEQVRQGILAFGRRLAGNEGEKAIILAAQAIRGVALGVVVTALVQSALAGLGLFVTGIPFAGILTAVIFMLAIAQLGPFLVLAPAIGWLYWTGDTSWATVLLVWSLLVGSIDNVLRPVLIKKGANLPLLLIFTGVIGGLIELGLVGIFIGPIALAVTYTLLTAWIEDTID